MPNRFYEGAADISFECGHCGHAVSAAVQWRNFNQRRGVVVASCTHCGEPSVFALGTRISTSQRSIDGAIDYYRYVSDQRPESSIHSYPADIVPEAVARRYVDVQRAMKARLWEQAIVSSRTAVQVMARLEKVKRGSLASEIELLMEKRGHELAELVRTIAHRIRDAGNEAAHPDDPDWSPTKEEAEEALVFLRALIEWLYALPSTLREVDEAVKEGGDAAGADSELDV